MKLILALLLLTCSAQASDLQARRYGDGYVMRFVQDGAVHCWGMPDLADLSYFDPSWLPVTETAVRYAWPVGDAAFAAVCNEMPTVKRVVQMVEGEPVYMRIITEAMRLRQGVEVPAGLPCGDVISRYYNTPFYWASVTYGGQTGVALCG